MWIPGLPLAGGKVKDAERRVGTFWVKKERSLRQKRSEETLGKAVGDTEGFICILDVYQDETSILFY